MTKIVVLMATYKGDRFLSEQLESIRNQDHRDWSLWISDDGSTDRTREIIARFAASLPEGQVVLLDGPGKGATANFLSLLRRCPPGGHHLAFCDQDDVWDRDHLTRALTALAREANPLAVYGCRMRVCDGELRQTGLSPLPARPLGFRNALVQNVLSGNTMVMTPAAAELLQQAEAEGRSTPVHDWWAYQLITGAGGAAILDAHPGIFYRQHGHNVIGANRGLRSLPARLGRYMRGTHREWANATIAAMTASKARLTPENQRHLADFTAALSGGIPGKVAALRRSGIYYQSPQARAMFWLAVLSGRF